jgi:predicted acylesterase/phospholipase RssA
VVIIEVVETSSKVLDIIEYECESYQESKRLEKTKSELKKKMQHATSYSEWKIYAEQFDNLKDVKLWKDSTDTDSFDSDYIKELTKMLKQCRKNDEVMRVIHIVRSNSVRNISNILNPRLYRRSYIGTKTVIEEFQLEYACCLEYLADLPPHKLSYEKKVELFAEMRHAYGRTAMLFSGGATLGLYHFGVIKCLYDEGLLPRIIAGSSVGSIFASFIGTTRFEDIPKLFEVGRIKIDAFSKRGEKFSVWRKIKRFFTEGWLMDISVIRDFVRDNIGDLTFQEAYDNTGWILNITVTGYGDHDNYRLLNYLTAPNVLVWSAVCASCAIPYIYGPVDLYCKNENSKVVPYIPGGRKFIDGSVGADLPMQSLSELFNVNCFMVSQTNPWVIPFMNHSEGFRHSRKYVFVRVYEVLKGIIASELKHRVNQLSSVGILPTAITRYFNLITQEYSGNVTIWPIPTLRDYLNILNNPSHQSLQKGLILGARRTYHKINHIHSTLMIEKSLDWNYRAIKLQNQKIADRDEEEEYDKKGNNLNHNASRLSLMSESEYIPEEPNKRNGRLSSFIIPRTGSINEIKYMLRVASRVKLARGARGE